MSAPDPEVRMMAEIEVRSAAYCVLQDADQEDRPLTGAERRLRVALRTLRGLDSQLFGQPPAEDGLKPPGERIRWVARDGEGESTFTEAGRGHQDYVSRDVDGRRLAVVGRWIGNYESAKAWFDELLRGGRS
jgi:hypothetical protein